MSRAGLRSRPEGCLLRGGFTLIELLVVVAIIATLMSVLLPALAHARQQGRSVKCLAHARELSRGLLMYQIQWGCYPGHKLPTEDGGSVRWYQAMADLLGGFDVQQCPSTPDWTVGRNNSYGYNYKYVGSLRTNTEPENPHRPYEAFPIRSVRAPARTISFADNDGTGRELPWRDSGEPDGKNWRRLGNHGYTLDPTYIPLYSEHTLNSEGVPEPYAWRNFRTFMSNRHLRKASTVFLDGHAEFVDPCRAYRDNALWNGLGFDPGDDPESPFYKLDRHVDYRIDESSGQAWPFEDL